jgi:hypothetical protein
MEPVSAPGLLALPVADVLHFHPPQPDPSVELRPRLK